LSRKTITSLSAVLALTLPALSAQAEPKDREVTALAKAAMDGDYLGTQFKEAEQKLQKALKTCGKKKCSANVQATLHLDLAVVYIAGEKKKDKGKKELAAAIAADSSVELSQDFSTPEVEKLFVAAGGARPEPAPAPPAHDEDEDEPKPPVEAAKEEEPDAGGARHNWLTASFQQDFMSYSQTNGVCSGAAQFQCFLQGQSYSGPIFDGSGNQVQGGIGLATKRVLIGYDRLLGDNFMLGLRVGFAFGGSPKATTGSGAAFLPFHAEARASYWFGDAPFASSGLRGYAGLALGLAELDGHVSVEYFQDRAGYDANAKGKLDAWRKTGNVMLGLHAGIAYAFTTEQELLLELRILQMVGESGLGGAVNIGYGFGL
jgi:hypothetical protein